MSTQRISDDNIISTNNNNNATTRLSADLAGSTSRIADTSVIGSAKVVGSVNGVPTHLSEGVTLDLNGQQYNILKHITSSGEAEIYLVEGKDGNVILKYYFSNYKPKDEILTRLHALKRRDIMSPLDSGVYQDRFFELSEYMTGGTMDALAPLRDINMVRKYADLIVEALKACHDNGIIHRDIKPVNIFFRSPSRDEIALGDFGISSALQAGSDYRFTNSVNRTTAYAAPELFTNINNQTTLDKKVDYYALGISFLELWLGADPFKDMAEFMAMRIKIEGRVAIPAEMNSELKNLIKGLITTEPPKRWGYEEVKKWLAGEYVKVHETIMQKAFQPYEWDDLNNIVVDDPKELAGLMDADRKKATRQLYSRSIPHWVKNNSQDMYSELLFIVEKEFPNTTPENAAAGVTKAIYTLDRERSFKGFDGTICNSINDIARHIDSNLGYYTEALKNPHADLYLFFETRGFDDRIQKYLKYYGNYNPKKALNLIVLDLDDNNLIIGDKTYDNVQLLMKANDASLNDFVQEVADPDSKISLWLAITYHNLATNIAEWRKNVNEQNVITLGYALNTSGYKLNNNEATDVAGFYQLLQNNLDYIIGNNSDAQNNAQKADYWLRYYQNSSLYAQLDNILNEATLSTTQLSNIYSLMLTLPEGQSFDIIVAPEFLKRLSALSISEKEHMADITITAFKTYWDNNLDLVVYGLDVLEIMLALVHKLNDFDKAYAVAVLTRLDSTITKYTLNDLKKMQQNSDTFFAYYDRLIAFYFNQVKPIVPDLTSLANFEKKKTLIDRKRQEITAKYDLEEDDDKKKIEVTYSKFEKKRENYQMEYEQTFTNYVKLFWITSSIIIFYFIIVFDVIVFQNTSWWIGVFVSIGMSLFIGLLSFIGYGILMMFGMRKIIGKLLMRPILKDTNSYEFEQLKTNKETLANEKNSKLVALDKRNQARIDNDVFGESIKILLNTNTVS